MQGRRDYPSFNIRKVQRRALVKQPEELGLFTPEYEYEKYPEVHTFTNPKKEKESIIDQSVNEAILASKTYCDLKQNYLETKRKNGERKDKLIEVEELKRQRREVEEEAERLEGERAKFQELMNDLKDRILEVRHRNHQARQYLQNRMNNEAEYLSNLLMSMRFQAEYEHDIDPDQMTYEELLQLGEKIGSVSRGLPAELLQHLPVHEVKETTQDQCTVCCCVMEIGEIVTLLPPCQHSFHRECVTGWLLKEKQCPLCKQEVVIK